MIKEKIIHQICFENYNLKLNYIENLNNENFNKIIKQSKFKNKQSYLSWIDKNKQWRYILWSEFMVEELLEKYYKNSFLFYRTLSKRKRVNFSKYIILYHYGGVFVSEDIICLKSINNFINFFKKYDIILSKYPSLNLLERSYYKYFYNLKDLVSDEIIISNKYSSFLLIVINFLMTSKEYKNSNNDFIFLSKCYAINKRKYPNLIPSNNIFLIPCNKNDISCKKSDISYSIYDWSLRNIFKLIYNSYLRNLKKNAILLIGITIIISILYL